MNIVDVAPIVVAFIGALVSVYGIWRQQRSEQRAVDATRKAEERRLEIDRTTAAAALTEAASEFISGLQKEIAKLQDQVGHLGVELKATKQQIVEQQVGLAAAQRRITAQETKIQAQALRIDELEGENARLREELHN